jgi:bacterioferritin (cytochrome b1)
MDDVKKVLVDMLNAALRLEHAARIQYLAHAEILSGKCAEKLVERIKEIAADEEKHEQMFRKLIGSYLDSVPTMDLAERHPAKDLNEVLSVNMQDEKNAIDVYKRLYRKVVDSKEALQYEFETLEHDIRHVILDEEEHVVELKLLVGT